MDLGLIYAALPDLLDGVGVTLLLTAFAVPTGFLIAWPLAFARLSNNALLVHTALAYGYLFRGTPLLVQLYLVYYGLSQYRVALEGAGLWWLFRDPVRCSLLVLSLNTAAYSAEIFRGAIVGIGAGQIDAARALGLSWRARTWRIVMPQALRLAWPAYTNEVVFLMQATSLVSLVTVTDLFRAADLIAVRTFKFYTMYAIVAALYLALSYAIILSFGQIERRLAQHSAQATRKEGPRFWSVVARLTPRG